MINVPIYIPVYNNGNYVEYFINQLFNLGFKYITIIDNNSSDKHTKLILNSFEKLGVRVLYLKHNFGPRYPLLSKRFTPFLPKYFFYSDPDLILPSNFNNSNVKEMFQISKKFNLAKVGLSLNIFHENIRADLKISINDKLVHVKDWEEQFWLNSLGTLSNGDKFFDADIDTTFCLVNSYLLNQSNFFDGIRIGGSFTAEHIPWLKNPPVELESPSGPFSNWNRVDSNDGVNYYRLRREYNDLLDYCIKIENSTPKFVLLHLLKRYLKFSKKNIL
jgi:hypothetical protein